MTDKNLASAQNAQAVNEYTDHSGAAELRNALMDVRARTVHMADGLSDADATVQSMPDASPAKWHLAHTTWFFETFILKEHFADYKEFNPKFGFLFNSYYEAHGARHPRPRRGMITRPTLDEILEYRAYVDDAIKALDIADFTKFADLFELGLHHEQQHQELFLTDLLHLFSQNPISPVYREGAASTDASVEQGQSEPLPLTWTEHLGGEVEMGARAEGFAYDCERPRHKRLVNAFALANRPVTNGEWIKFIESGAYQKPDHWLSDGWAAILKDGLEAPLYWQEIDGVWHQMTLHGLKPVQLDAPVCHISYFEADAYASWAGYRLPREEEWEAIAASASETGHFAGEDQFIPRSLENTSAMQALFGTVWEWTQSAFTQFPGFRPLEGAAGEYNGKFMCGQFVLKGGSLATPDNHIRATYRNFFYPHQRWQYTGLRLAKDI